MARRGGDDETVDLAARLGLDRPVPAGSEGHSVGAKRRRDAQRNGRPRPTTPPELEAPAPRPQLETGPSEPPADDPDPAQHSRGGAHAKPAPMHPWGNMEPNDEGRHATETVRELRRAQHRHQMRRRMRTILTGAVLVAVVVVLVLLLLQQASGLE